MNYQYPAKSKGRRKMQVFAVKLQDCKLNDSAECVQHFVVEIWWYLTLRERQELSRKWKKETKTLVTLLADEFDRVNCLRNKTKHQIR